jgi:hypothetical protein
MAQDSSPTGGRGKRLVPAALVVLAFSAGFMALEYLIATPAKTPPISVPVRFTDIRQSAGITFQHDNTFTAQKKLYRDHGQRLGLD